jgi:hypothetical protein
VIPETIVVVAHQHLGTRPACRKKETGVAPRFGRVGEAIRAGTGPSGSHLHCGGRRRIAIYTVGLSRSWRSFPGRHRHRQSLWVNLGHRGAASATSSRSTTSRQSLRRAISRPAQPISPRRFSAAHQARQELLRCASRASRPYTPSVRFHWDRSKKCAAPKV